MASEARRTAADKTLDVLEALAQHRSIAEISEVTSLPKPTVHRILQTLVERGFARCLGRGSYASGPRILTLVGSHQREVDLPNQAVPTLEESVLALLKRTGMPARTDHTHTDPAKLLHELAAVRERGYAEDHEENEAGVIAVGAPVFDHSGTAVGGMSAATLSNFSDADSMTRCGRAVAAAAKRFSLTLGAPPHRSALTPLRPDGF